MKIAGSVAVITGGASGLGRATAERLLAGDGKVALLDLPKSAGVEVARNMGGSALFAACDVTSADEVAAALEAAAALGAVRADQSPASAAEKAGSAQQADPRPGSST
jgi:NAD(P)-dependent dehydrogenase (short-subunit alcohol dehydrogenase family)